MKLEDYIRERTIHEATYIMLTDKTLRQTAKNFGVCKSTVHVDMVKRLPKINPEIAGKVDSILQQHKKDRAKNGGWATKMMYKKQREQ